MPDSACGASSPTLDGPRQRAMIDLNCGTLVELCHMMLGPMLERGSGAILNVASTAAFQPGPGMATYFATKAFVLSFTEALHEEVASKGIRVTALCPGPTRTEFGEVAGFASNGAFDRISARSEDVVAFGLKSARQGPRGRDPRAAQQGRGTGAPADAACVAAADRGVAQTLSGRFHAVARALSSRAISVAKRGSSRSESMSESLSIHIFCSLPVMLAHFSSAPNARSGSFSRA